LMELCLSHRESSQSIERRFLPAVPLVMLG